MRRVGHKGADHIAPGNTIESFEAALEHAGLSGELEDYARAVLAHEAWHLRGERDELRRRQIDARAGGAA